MEETVMAKISCPDTQDFEARVKDHQAGLRAVILRPTGGTTVSARLSSILILLLLSVSGCRQASDQATPKSSGNVRNTAGMQLRVVEENTQPTLRIVLPGHPASDRAIEVIFPEHVTVRPRGSTDAKQLYIFQPGQYGERPLWRQSERSLEYERDFPGAVHMLARATLEEDGVRFHFRLRNQSDTAYDLVWASPVPQATCGATRS